MLKVGLALYSVRNEMNRDPLATLDKVGKLGYKYVEAANFALDSDPLLGFNLSAENVKEKLDEFGMKLVSCHIGRVDMYEDASKSLEVFKAVPQILKLKDDDIARCSEAHLKVGNDKLICPVLFYPNDRDGILKNCEYLNHISELCKKYGTKFVYHNHYQEFVSIDNKLIFEYLYENTDLLFELDSFWAMRGGENPIDIMKRFGDRIIMVHQKDYSKDTMVPSNIWHTLGPDMKTGKYPHRSVKEREFFTSDIPETYTEIGTGIMPIQDIINAVNEYTNAKYVLLEQDYSEKYQELESIQISMDKFKSYKGIEWS